LTAISCRIVRAAAGHLNLDALGDFCRLLERLELLLEAQRLERELVQLKAAL
jgi:hypothetical protein